MSKTHSSWIHDTYPLESKTNAKYGNIKRSGDSAVSGGRSWFKEDTLKLRPEGEGLGGPKKIRVTAGAKARRRVGLACWGIRGRPALEGAWTRVLALNKSALIRRGCQQRSARLWPHTVRASSWKPAKADSPWLALPPPEEACGAGGRAVGRTGPHCECPAGAVGKQKTQVCPGPPDRELRRAH